MQHGVLVLVYANYVFKEIVVCDLKMDLEKNIVALKDNLRIELAMVIEFNTNDIIFPDGEWFIEFRQDAFIDDVDEIDLLDHQFFLEKLYLVRNKRFHGFLN